MRGRTNITQRSGAIVNGDVVEAEVIESNIDVGDFVEYKEISANQGDIFNTSSFGKVVYQQEKIEEGKYLLLVDTKLMLLKVDGSGVSLKSTYSDYDVRSFKVLLDGTVVCKVDNGSFTLVRLEIRNDALVKMHQTSRSVSVSSVRSYRSLFRQNGNTLYVYSVDSEQSSSNKNKVYQAEYTISDSSITYSKESYAQTQYSTELEQVSNITKQMFECNGNYYVMFRYNGSLNFYKMNLGAVFNMSFLGNASSIQIFGDSDNYYSRTIMLGSFDDKILIMYGTRVSGASSSALRFASINLSTLTAVITDDISHFGNNKQISADVDRYDKFKNDSQPINYGILVEGNNLFFNYVTTSTSSSSYVTNSVKVLCYEEATQKVVIKSNEYKDNVNLAISNRCANSGLVVLVNKNTVGSLVRHAKKSTSLAEDEVINSCIISVSSNREDLYGRTDTGLVKKYSGNNRAIGFAKSGGKVGDTIKVYVPMEE